MHAAVARRGLASAADARAAPGAPGSSNGARVGDATRGAVEAREAWLDAFELQVTPAMLARVKRYALRRARKIREVLDAAGGSIQLAYRDVSHQSDQDLRVLLAALQDAAQRRE